MAKYIRRRRHRCRCALTKHVVADYLDQPKSVGEGDADMLQLGRSVEDNRHEHVCSDGHCSADVHVGGGGLAHGGHGVANLHGLPSDSKSQR